MRFRMKTLCLFRGVYERALAMKSRFFSPLHALALKKGF